jgi:hypothetical protein
MKEGLDLAVGTWLEWGKPKLKDWAVGIEQRAREAGYESKYQAIRARFLLTNSGGVVFGLGRPDLGGVNWV